VQADTAVPGMLEICYLMSGTTAVNHDDAAVGHANCAGEQFDVDPPAAGREVWAELRVSWIGSFFQRWPNEAVVAAVEFTLHHRDPAQLAVMRVNGSMLSGQPAKRENLEELVAVDQISGVMIGTPQDVWSKGFGRRAGLGEEVKDTGRGDWRAFQFLQGGNEVADAGSQGVRVEGTPRCIDEGHGSRINVY